MLIKIYANKIEANFDAARRVVWYFLSIFSVVKHRREVNYEIYRDN